MNEDAKFNDGREIPLNLGAVDVEDLRVISSLVQDSIFPITEMSWYPQKRCFALLLNRFRWEDKGRQRHGAERVQSVLAFENVIRVASQSLDRSDPNYVMSLLCVEYEPIDEPAGYVLLTFAGDCAVRLEVEALEVTLKDVTRPYKAPSGEQPSHHL